MLGVVLLLQATAATPAPYHDRSLPIEVRTQDLLRRMTLEEKFWQLYMTPGDRDDPSHDWSHGIYGLQVSPAPGHADAGALAARINSLQHYFVDSTRLGIPMIPFEEGLHGIVRSEGTVFPQAIGLAAAFDTALMREVASAVADETGSRGIRQVLSPVLNIASDVRWGRTEETYGEDPWWSARMGVAFVAPFERAGVVTTLKHMIANVGEGGRDSYPIDATPRELAERFFPPFVAAIREGGARSVMSAYNSVNALPATQNPWLLTSVLRHEWGFTGITISDAAATGGPTVLQMTEPDTPHAAEHAWEAGLDVVFQSEWGQHRSYWHAVRDGLVAPAIIDSAVARVLRLKFALGLFDRPYVDTTAAGRAPRDSEHRALARRAAVESMVLLKNSGVLPLTSRITSVAIIGTDAVEGRPGGYSGPGMGTISILQGMKEGLPHAAVRYAPGPGRLSPDFTTVPATALRLEGRYFVGPDLAGPPALVRPDPIIDFAWTLSSPSDSIANDWFSARWEGTLTAPRGLTRLGVEGDDGYRLWLDGKLLIDRWTPGTSRATLEGVRLAPGTRHPIRLEFRTSVPNARVRLIWDAGVDRAWGARIRDAVALARRSAVAVVVVGIEEGEFRDRSSLALPGHQEELIRSVAATGTPTVVVLVGGSAVTMSGWLDQVAGVVMAWYPGEEGGHALADILTGKDSPAGRVPITFPVREGQLPLYYDHRPTGRGDDYVDGTGEPLFPFGFGLSYTSFTYSGLSVTPDSAAGALPVTVRCTVTNTGDRAGDEVVQLYIHDEIASRSRPVMALRGVQRIHLAPRESRTLTFPLTARDLALYTDDGRWTVEPGSFRIMVGASSRDIRLQEHFIVR